MSSCNLSLSVARCQPAACNPAGIVQGSNCNQSNGKVICCIRRWQPLQRRHALSLGRRQSHSLHRQSDIFGGVSVGCGFLDGWGFQSLPSDSPRPKHQPRAVPEGARSMASSTPKRKPVKEVVLVDPVEAKRIAAAAMKKLEEQKSLREKLRVEAINGGWAVIGVTSALAVEALTGNGIFVQVSGYINQLATLIEDSPLTKL